MHAQLRVRLLVYIIEPQVYAYFSSPAVATSRRRIVLQIPDELDCTAQRHALYRGNEVIERRMGCEGNSKAVP